MTDKKEKVFVEEENSLLDEVMEQLSLKTEKPNEDLGDEEEVSCEERKAEDIHGGKEDVGCEKSSSPNVKVDGDDDDILIKINGKEFSFEDLLELKKSFSKQKPVPQPVAEVQLPYPATVPNGYQHLFPTTSIPELPPHERCPGIYEYDPIGYYGWNTLVSGSQQKNYYQVPSQEKYHYYQYQYDNSMISLLPTPILTPHQTLVTPITSVHNGVPATPTPSPRRKVPETAPIPSVHTEVPAPISSPRQKLPAPTPSPHVQLPECYITRQSSVNESEHSTSETVTRSGTHSLVKNLQDLSSLGKSYSLDIGDAKYKTISRYFKNSSYLKDSSGVRVKIHGMLEFDLKKGSSSSGTQFNRLLLFWKTTVKSVTKLKDGDDGLYVFYDRVSPACADKPENLMKPLRQVIILCSVKLGNMLESPHGRKYWSSKEFPEGSDSIKCIGRYTPDWEHSRDDNGTEIPCGKTLEHGKLQKYGRDYSEYIIKEKRRITVRYAVDVEFIPA